jgi:MoaA/NifB/PqqE/SkfB family radical SAM enzyme
MNQFPTATTPEEIKYLLQKTKISSAQIDTNGRCNAKCWYCPVRYEGNPVDYTHQTTPAELEHILLNIRSSKLYPEISDFMYTCHYNEVLLYKYLEELLVLFRKYRFSTMILSNGTPLIPRKLDILLKYPDVMKGICLNIPAFEENDWMNKTGFTPSIYKTLRNNLDYLHIKFPGTTIQINHTKDSDSQFYTSQQELEKIINGFKSAYPSFNIYEQGWLSDRAGRLSKIHVIKPSGPVNQVRTKGCRHSGTNGGRIYEWLHINSKGDLFLCCDDFNMEYKFGSLLEKSFDDIWLSDEHVQTILRAQESICTDCVFAIK